MKRTKIIGIIVVACIVVIAAGGMGYEAYASTGSKSESSVATNSEKPKNTQNTNNKTESVQKVVDTKSSSNAEKIKSTNDVANDKEAIKKTTENSNVQNEFEIELDGAKVINIASNPSLNSAGNEFVSKANGVAAWIAKASKEQRFQSGYGMQKLGGYVGENYLTLGKSLIQTINNNVTTNIANMLNSQNIIWQNYIKSENAAISNDGGSIVPVDEANNYGTIEGNEVNFNIYNYLFDNGVNPQFSPEFITSGINNMNSNEFTQAQKNTFNNASNEINNIQNKGTEIINNAINNKTSLLTAYNQVYNLWNDYLNKLYSNFRSTSVYKSQMYQEEVPWVTFKEQMINTINEAYPNNPENALAKATMNIRLTEAQIINLLGYTSTT